MDYDEMKTKEEIDQEIADLLAWLDEERMKQIELGIIEEEYEKRERLTES